MNKFALLLPLLALCYANIAGAQRFAPGYCPTVTGHENFEKSKFFGNWIEVEKTPSIFDLMMRCLVVDYSDDQNDTVNVVVRGVSLAGLPLTVNGDGVLPDLHRSSFYSIRYGFGVPFQGTQTTIVDTDYDDYAVVYSCTNSLLSGVFHSEYIWVLSRSGKISNPTRQNIYEKLDKLQINRSGLTMSDRSTCPTNSTTMARESDKDLAGQGAAAAPITVAGGQQAAAASEQQAAATSSPTANLEKANSEPAQKSVVVPLLYDLPTSASSSSVGGKPAPVAKAPPAPVDNKVPQLPLASASQAGQVRQQAAPAKPVAQAAPAAGQQAAVVGQAVQQAAGKPAVVAAAPAPVAGQQQQQQQQLQPQQQSGLLSKIQPKQ